MNDEPELFSYLGFDCIVSKVGGSFKAAILNRGQPIVVFWNGRNCWDKKRRAKDATHQYIKKKMPITLDSVAE